ncbi:hypothetical protein M758_4G187100 [Ceratodon purpureus]|nr:hypothetical protein M758_4G187100 [Ceratodon purpureus]
MPLALQPMILHLGSMVPAIRERERTVLLNNFVQRLGGNLHLLAQVGKLDGPWAKLPRPQDGGGKHGFLAPYPTSTTSSLNPEPHNPNNHASNLHKHINPNVVSTDIMLLSWMHDMPLVDTLLTPSSSTALPREACCCNL